MSPSFQRVSCLNAGTCSIGAMYTLNRDFQLFNTKQLDDISDTLNINIMSLILQVLCASNSPMIVRIILVSIN